MNKLAEVEGLLYTRSNLLLHCVSTESKTTTIGAVHKLLQFSQKVAQKLLQNPTVAQKLRSIF